MSTKVLNMYLAVKQKKGIDCSGLIMVACGMKEKERFTTHNPEMLEKYGICKAGYSI